DTDDGGFPDGSEVTEGTDPNDPDDDPGLIVVQPSFTPIQDPEVGEYEPDTARSGLWMQENHYNPGTVFHNNTVQNYDRVAINPDDFPPTRSEEQLQPFFDHGGGGQVTNNLPYIDGGGNHF
ncbi:MAG: hypothetical protein GWO24_10065, partial [Akkermansiaceae bacterium]|nr:hypothetical protein [Akkermansiaceae bacterium]